MNISFDTLPVADKKDNGDDQVSSENLRASLTSKSFGKDWLLDDSLGCRTITNEARHRFVVDIGLVEANDEATDQRTLYHQSVLSRSLYHRSTANVPTVIGSVSRLLAANYGYQLSPVLCARDD